MVEAGEPRAGVSPPAGPGRDWARVSVRPSAGPTAQCSAHLVQAQWPSAVISWVWGGVGLGSTFLVRVYRQAQVYGQSAVACATQPPRLANVCETQLCESIWQGNFIALIYFWFGLCVSNMKNKQTQGLHDQTNISHSLDSGVSKCSWFHLLRIRCCIRCILAETNDDDFKTFTN